MNEYGELIGEDTVRFRRVLPGPIERVWAHLVDGDKRGRWLCSGDTEQEVGGAIRMVFRNDTLSKAPDVAPPERHKDMPEEVAFSGTVTECDPPRRFSHTWEFDDERSEVCYELEERGDEVLLTLTHKRLDTRELKVDVCGGWHTHLDILVDILNDREPQAFWKRVGELEVEYRERIPA